MKSDISMASVAPMRIQSDSVLKGQKGQVGAQERYDMTDGTYLEFETVS